MHYMLFYEVEANFIQKRAQYRTEHLALAWQAHEKGELLLAGALDEPIDTAVLLFQAASPAVAEQFAAADPYVRNGLVKKWRVRQWNTVVGESAANPGRVNPRA
jgi:uncharacterized protein